MGKNSGIALTTAARNAQQIHITHRSGLSECLPEGSCPKERRSVDPRMVRRAFTRTASSSWAAGDGLMCCSACCCWRRQATSGH